MTNFTTESGLILSELSSELSIFFNDIPSYILLAFVLFCIGLLFIIIGILIKLISGVVR